VYKAFFAIFLFLIPLLSPANPLQPLSTEYFSEAQFAQAAGAQCLSGITASSDIDFDGVDEGVGNGHFISGRWQSMTEKYSVDTWTFSQPVYAFGGTWNFDPVTTGLQIYSAAGLYFLPDGIVSSGRQWTGFWGFVSTVPIESVQISFGDEGHPGNFAQTYTFTNRELVTGAPEPASLPLFSLGAAFVLLRYLFRRKNLPHSPD
jgi:hypothetical protein